MGQNISHQQFAVQFIIRQQGDNYIPAGDQGYVDENGAFYVDQNNIIYVDEK